MYSKKLYITHRVVSLTLNPCKGGRFCDQGSVSTPIGIAGYVMYGPILYREAYFHNLFS